MSDIKFDIYESPANDGEKKNPCEKYQQADDSLEGLDTRNYTLYFSKPLGLGGSGRGTDRYSSPRN